MQNSLNALNKYLIAYRVPSVMISSGGIETNATSTCPKGTWCLIGETANKNPCSKGSDRNVNQMLGWWELMGREIM